MLSTFLVSAKLDVIIALPQVDTLPSALTSRCATTALHIHNDLKYWAGDSLE